MEDGYLKVSVSLAREGAPAVAARVTVIAGSQTRTLITDASGLTERITISAPDRALSLDPDYTGDVYSTCNISVEFEKFKPTFIYGVQIFAGIEAIQPVLMEPRTLGGNTASWDLHNEYIIPPHNVNDLEDPDTGLPAPGRILNFVAIPEYVTVHLGTPTSNAENVTVTFANYIKNVCSSEIYPTWPENSIRANINCQISLVLNRIVTEWYPSRGYNYDITNSTSYDQYFVKGRNIYENISEIVDGMFDQYIRKGTAQEPYYAEYCNGTTVTCPGLSQWGTVTLANQGYTPLEILRYYYGSDVALYLAPVVTSVGESYPGTALRAGSSGSSVAVIQEQLARIAQNYPLIPAVGTADGVFGARTTAAVRYFQSIFDLPVDGIVGKATWYKLSYIYSAVLRLAELGSEGITSPNIINPVPTAVIRTGSSGDLVTLAQYLLNAAADFYISLSRITMDGVYGSGTAAAVREFQRTRNLTADGIIGPNTWNELYKVFFSVMNSITPIGTNSYGGTALRVGSTGLAVATIQRYLTYIHIYFPSVPALTIDSIFGNGTRTAVIEFQRIFGLTVDGVVGRQTWNRIVAVYETVVTYD